jgi:hypothetical protein
LESLKLSKSFPFLKNKVYLKMKTAYLSSLCMLIMTGLVSCDNEETAATTDSSTTTTIPNTRSISSISSSARPINAATTVVSNPTTTSTATGLNPAHGLPNHRCDIAVGAPLNSAPTKTAGLQTQSPVAISPVQGNSPVQVSAPIISNPINPVKTNTTTVAGMNPPHGQPNHRCDIAVGAPLNSAPTKTTGLQTAGSVKPTAAPTIVAPGMNPPHGQPNHRCDIAVGAPLNSAPINKVVPAATTVPAQIVSPIQPLQNNSNSTAKLNPAHGQPGHDCSIPVGQPLKQ